MQGDSTALARQDATPITPMAMIQRAFDSAIENNQGLEVMDRILAQMKEQRDYEDKVAFQAALRRIQNALKPIAKLGWNPQTSSKYATAESIDVEIQRHIEKEGMTLSFEPRPSDKPAMVFIVGVLSLGAYSKEYPLEMPADGQGAKGGGVMSRTHATGSALTYGKRYLKNAIFDLRFKEKDDDGNAAATGSGMPETDQVDFKVNIENANSVQDLNLYYLKACERAASFGDKSAHKSFSEARAKRKKELDEGR